MKPSSPQIRLFAQASSLLLASVEDALEHDDTLRAKPRVVAIVLATAKHRALGRRLCHEPLIIEGRMWLAIRLYLPMRQGGI